MMIWPTRPACTPHPRLEEPVRLGIGRMALLLLLLLADRAEGGTFDPIPLLPDAGVTTLSRGTSETMLARRLFSQPYAATSIRHVDLYDRFPYLEVQDLLVVSDPGWNRLLVGASGEGFAGFDGSGTSFGPLSAPRGLDADDADHIYVCDTGNNRVLCFRAEVEFETIDLVPVFEIRPVSRPFDVSWSDGGTPFEPKDDRLYVAETGMNRISRYDLTGSGARFAGVIGSLGSGIGCFAGPTAIASSWTAGGTVRLAVADAHNQRLVLLRDGPEGFDWTGESPLAASPVTSLEWDPFGNLFAASPAGSVVKLNPDLELVAELPGAAPRVFHLPTSIVMDHRTGETRHESDPEALLVQAWGRETGISRLRLGLGVTDARLRGDGAVSFAITDAANVTLEAWDPAESRWREVEGLGVLEAGRHTVARPALLDRDAPLRLRARSLYTGGDTAFSLLGSPRGEGSWTLLGAGPNPSRGATTLRLWLPRRAAVDLSVYDVGGRLVRQMSSDPAGPGPAEIIWDGRDESGHPAGSGFYVYRVRAEGATLSGRVLVLR